VPPGGGFGFLLSTDYANGVTIPGRTATGSERDYEGCYLVDGGTTTSLECTTGVTSENRTYVHIVCDERTFGEDGTPENEELKFQITGLTNPRLQDYESAFEVYTMDDQGRHIDDNKADTKFSVTMTELLPMGGVAVTMANKTNGVRTQYTIMITPSTQVHDYDVFTIEFPEELSLPDAMECGTADPELVLAVSCTNPDRPGGTVEIELTSVSENLVEGTAFRLTVDDVQNAPSTAPTSDFTSMTFSTPHGPSGSGSGVRYYLTEYRGPPSVFVSNDFAGQISCTAGGGSASGDSEDALEAYQQGSSAGASIWQSSRTAGEETENTIVFETNNPLPPSAAIVLSVPRTVARVSTNPDDCRIVISSTSYANACDFAAEGYQITYTGAFSDQDAAFRGLVELHFKTENPAVNSAELS